MYENASTTDIRQAAYENQLLDDYERVERDYKMQTEDEALAMRITHQSGPPVKLTEVPKKPNWDDAPDWANWLAQDEDGEWYWFEHRPVLDDGTWVKNTGTSSDLEYTMADFAGLGDKPMDCWETLQRRPSSDPVDDPVFHPTHYNVGDIECIDAIKASMTAVEYRGYLKGNTEKYLWRYTYKNGLEDLKKASWYLNRLIDSMETE